MTIICYEVTNLLVLFLFSYMIEILYFVNAYSVETEFILKVLIIKYNLLHSRAHGTLILSFALGLLRSGMIPLYMNCPN